VIIELPNTGLRHRSRGPLPHVSSRHSPCYPLCPREGRELCPATDRRPHAGIHNVVSLKASSDVDGLCGHRCNLLAWLSPARLRCDHRFSPMSRSSRGSCQIGWLSGRGAHPRPRSPVVNKRRWPGPAPGPSWPRWLRRWLLRTCLILGTGAIPFYSHPFGGGTGCRVGAKHHMVGVRRVLSGRVGGLSQFIGSLGSCSKESPNGRLVDLDAGRCGRGEWTRLEPRMRANCRMGIARDFWPSWSN